MKFLLTNDDGVDAPGLAALHRSVEQIMTSHDEVIVVAPDRQRSECGHSVTQRRPLTIQRLASDWFSVDGTPVDCVRVAIHHLAKDIDIVLSGVNQGANLGVDTLVSGTVAAAREASLHVGLAIAISQYRHPDIERTWDHVPNWIGELLSDLITRRVDAKSGQQSPLAWNVNLPALPIDRQQKMSVPAIVECPLDTRPHHRDAEVSDQSITLASNFQSRPHAKGTDVDQCFGGNITLTKLVLGK